MSFGPGSGQPQVTTIAQATDAKIHRRISMVDKLKNEYQAGPNAKSLKESNSERLKHILQEPALRQLFRDFLRGNFCEENLTFWIEVEDFKRKFQITSSAVASTSTRPMTGKSTPGQAAMEKHHESLIEIAVRIYRTFLAPSSPAELNIDHGLRNELVAYLSEVLSDMTGKGQLESVQAQQVNATQLQTIIQHYQRIQNHVFRLMATDSVPKVRHFFS